ncbi:MAG: Helix-turn-helix, AraC protein [Gemmatimonadetes bacterium]|jgi:AraC-like DNA-binding protein|nr:Helix-turn-helix, AraC protein [Gemmatimonadota bacterium]
MPLRGGQSPVSDTASGVVLVLVIGAAERARVRAALRSRYEVQFVDKIVELTQGVSSAPSPLAGIIVESRDLEGRSTHDAIRQLRGGPAAVPLVGYCRPQAESGREIQALILSGVHELIYEGADDAGVALRAVLASAQRAEVGARAASALEARFPRRLWSLVRHATAHPDIQSVAALADALGYNRRTLVNHCADEGYPPPQELLTWCRLVVVGELLASTTRTIESIALQLDFPSDTALRNKIKRYTGLRASEVRARGGMRCVLDALDVALRERRRTVGAAS